MKLGKSGLAPVVQVVAIMALMTVLIIAVLSGVTIAVNGNSAGISVIAAPQ